MGDGCYVNLGFYVNSRDELLAFWCNLFTQFTLPLRTFEYKYKFMYRMNKN